MADGSISPGALAFLIVLLFLVLALTLIFHAPSLRGGWLWLEARFLRPRERIVLGSGGSSGSLAILVPAAGAPTGDAVTGSRDRANPSMVLHSSSPALPPAEGGAPPNNVIPTTTVYPPTRTEVACPSPRTGASEGLRLAPLTIVGPAGEEVVGGNTHAPRTGRSWPAALRALLHPKRVLPSQGDTQKGAVSASPPELPTTDLAVIRIIPTHELPPPYAPPSPPSSSS